MKNEYISAAQYIKNVMEDHARLAPIIARAEQLNMLEKKIVGLGLELDQEDSK